MLSEKLTELGVSCRIDTASSATIGRRYARTDEIAIPFGVTVDFETKDDGKATIRERDSMEQVRPPLERIPEVVAALAAQKVTWAEVVAEFGLFLTGEAAKAAAAAKANTAGP